MENVPIFRFFRETMSKMIGNSYKKLVDEDYIRRLQLAVTEENGCPTCSCQHTKMALKLNRITEPASAVALAGRPINNHVYLVFATLAMETIHKLKNI